MEHRLNRQFEKLVADASVLTAQSQVDDLRVAFMAGAVTGMLELMECRPVDISDEVYEMLDKLSREEQPMAAG